MSGTGGSTFAAGREVEAVLVGIALGTLIGVITGYVLVLLLGAAMPQKRPQASDTLKVVSELLAIPTFWFGGPWVTTAFLKAVDFAKIQDAYMGSLACTFILIAAYPLFRLVIWTGNQLGRAEAAADA